jgi:hypothetical protein
MPPVPPSSRLLRRAVVVLLALIMNVFVFLVLAGHSRWAGHRIYRLNASHGLNSGDVPVLVLWVVGMGCCWWLLREPHG